MNSAAEEFAPAEGADLPVTPSVQVVLRVERTDRPREVIAKLMKALQATPNWADWQLDAKARGQETRFAQARTERKRLKRHKRRGKR